MAAPSRAERKKPPLPRARGREPRKPRVSPRAPILQQHGVVRYDAYPPAAARYRKRAWQVPASSHEAVIRPALAANDAGPVLLSP